MIETSGVENGEEIEECPPPSQLGGLREHRELRQQVLGGAPAENKFGAFLASLTEHFCWNDSAANKRVNCLAFFYFPMIRLSVKGFGHLSFLFVCTRQVQFLGG